MIKVVDSRPFIRNRMVCVATVIQRLKSGHKAAELVDEYGIRLTDVQAAINYYRDNRDYVDDILAVLA